VDELIGTLQSYEEERLNEEDTRGKKSIALKSNLDANDSDLDKNDEDDEEIALMVKRLQKMARKERKFKGKKNPSKLLSIREVSITRRKTKMRFAWNAKSEDISNQIALF